MNAKDSQTIIAKIDLIQTKVESVESRMVTKDDLQQEIALVHKHIDESVESLAQGAQASFLDVDKHLVSVDTTLKDINVRLSRVEDNTDTLIRLDHQGQIDRLRDDVRLVRTKIGIA